ncbi:pantoate--beta-alanine ligase, partial [Bacillus paralicheniformis]|nr:pantoate--beta-alanine ligase [Bacillus paralicheniformis]
MVSYARGGVLVDIARSSSAHLVPVNVTYDYVGTSVLVSIAFTTGDAMGSNMASRAIALVSGYIKDNCPCVVDAFVPYPEAKKNVPARLKGKKVIARTVVRAEVLERLG